MILVDAGPLVALIDRRDRHHAGCVSALEKMREPLGTVWPALVEAFYLLRGVAGAPRQLCSFFERGAIALLPLDGSDLPRMRELMEKYADLPMDIADAALVRVAERDGFHRVFTIDRRDFSVYRLRGGRRVTIIS